MRRVCRHAVMSGLCLERSLNPQKNRPVLVGFWYITKTYARFSGFYGLKKYAYKLAS
ncbi:hypothetical protein ALP22_101180 [Pseudomonas coronafaciens pv. porri]|nr:hypothetical protein ALP22_101180 [Pseudomonas coronafaciens pv. porri]